jgi:hypothetical protein
MKTIRVQQTPAKDGEILISGLPPLTVRQFRQSVLIGMWKDRDDIQDSSVYARQLREAAQRRSHSDYDFTGYPEC